MICLPRDTESVTTVAIGSDSAEIQMPNGGIVREELTES